MATRARPSGRDEVSEAILDAAVDLMRERGPSTVSVREIARAADVNHGLVHHYFGGKPQLILRMLDRRAEHLAAAAPPGASAEELLAHLFGDPDAGLYTRLLAYVMVEQSSPGDGALQGWIAQRLIDRAGPDVGRPGPAPTAAAVMALMMGWELFRPVIAPLFGLAEPAATADVAGAAASLLTGDVAAAAPDPEG